MRSSFVVHVFSLVMEGLQTVGIVVIICASLKLLHLLGLIDFSEGKVVAPICAVGQVWFRTGYRRCRIEAA